MMMYLAIATIVGIVLAIIGGALMSAAQIKEYLRPLAYTLLVLGFGISFVLAVIWISKLT